MLIQTSGEDEWVAGRRVGSRPPRASVQRRFLIRSLARGSPPPTQEGEPSSYPGGGALPQDGETPRHFPLAPPPPKPTNSCLYKLDASQPSPMTTMFLPKIEFRAWLGESMLIFTALRYLIISTLHANTQ